AARVVAGVRDGARLEIRAADRPHRLALAVLGRRVDADVLLGLAERAVRRPRGERPAAGGALVDVRALVGGVVDAGLVLAARVGLLVQRIEAGLACRA